MNIVSPHKNPLEIINFNNLSSVNPKFDLKPIWKENIYEEEEESFRFYIMANFDFVPLADNYPFDWQHIYISYSVSDKNKYGIIQPIPESLLDKEFKIDGWKLKESTLNRGNRQISWSYNFREFFRSFPRKLRP